MRWFWKHELIPKIQEIFKNIIKLLALNCKENKYIKDNKSYSDKIRLVENKKKRDIILEICKDALSKIIIDKENNK